MLGTVFGLAAFLAFLLLAVQLLASLYATSVVTSVAYDAAKQVAAGGSIDEAERQARDLMGGVGGRAELSWDHDGGHVELRIVVPGPRLLAAGVGDVLPFSTIDRTVRVRVERTR